MNGSERVRKLLPNQPSWVWKVIGDEIDEREQRALASQPAPNPDRSPRCKCSMAQSLTGDGCRYCQLQDHIDRLDEWLDEARAEAETANDDREDAERYRNLLLWALYHHQGSGSPVGQPIRKALGIGQYERLTANQIDAATRAGEVKS